MAFKIPTRKMTLRCPSYSPGGDVKCERDADGHTDCAGRRPESSELDPGGLVRWKFITGTFYAPPLSTEEDVA